jgi:hypothetical protein
MSFFVKRLPRIEKKMKKVIFLGDGLKKIFLEKYL